MIARLTGKAEISDFSSLDEWFVSIFPSNYYLNRPSTITICSKNHSRRLHSNWKWEKLLSIIYANYVAFLQD